MKKLLSASTALAVFIVCTFSAIASTIYIPTDESDEYLPTVRILSYSLPYEDYLSPDASGSGTLIDANGTILTNNHVIANLYDLALPNDALQICLTKSNDPENPICEFTAKVLARDSVKDLALLKMDSKDISGKTINFDFYLPYDNSADPGIGDALTVIGYPDTGGRTITYTTGVVSGFITELGTKYMKTDADISFGNSGGTAVDADGNLIGVPTLVSSSYSYEALGYLLPLKDAVAWIKENISNTPTINEAAFAKLKKDMLSDITANNTGLYTNDYPPYEISLIDGWEFGGSLDRAFDNSSYGYYYGTESVMIYPEEYSATSQLYVGVSVSDYAYEVTLDDIEYTLGQYAEDAAAFGKGGLDAGYTYPGSTVERATFNGKYDVIKETYVYYDWITYADVTTVTYYIPYGDKVINVFYNYGINDAEKLSEVDEILATFDVDMTKIELSVVDSILSENPKILINNPLDDVYMDDYSYDYDGVHYFGASFGKKRDYSFYVSIYSNLYWDAIYEGDFEAFKDQTLKDAETWSNIAASGEFKLDGHDGFFYTDESDWGYGLTYGVYLYIENDDKSYFSISYSDDEETYKDTMADFKKILKAIKLDNNGGGQYFFPNFISYSGGVLKDIKNYVYEDSIRGLKTLGAFGDKVPANFEPANALTRKDFVVWAVKTLQGTSLTDYTNYETTYMGCEADCYKDVDYTSDWAIYIEYAKSKEAIKAGEKFKPDEQISLMAALKIIFELYDYEAWDAPDFIPWYVPYLHLGYKWGVMPYGVDDANYLLTRGEGAYIIYAVSNLNSGLYYYDDYLYY